MSSSTGARLSPGRPRGSVYWAREWRVSQKLARKILRHLHETLGSRVAWKVAGPRGRKAIVATAESLQVARVLRAGGSVAVVVGGSAAGPLEEDRVTREQLAEALSAIWDELRKLGSRVR